MQNGWVNINMAWDQFKGIAGRATAILAGLLREQEVLIGLA